MDFKQSGREDFKDATAHLPLDALAHHDPRATLTPETVLRALQEQGLQPKSEAGDGNAPMAEAQSASESVRPKTEPIAEEERFRLLAPPDDGGPPPAEADLTLGPVLGHGGMGQVRLGQQICLRRDVAIKMPHENERKSDRLRSIVQEGMVMGLVEHPNTVPVHQLGFDEKGQPLIVMKRISGTSWHDLITDPSHADWGPLQNDLDAQESRHLEVAIQVSQALSYAHAKGVIHRDVKPENVMIGRFGEVYLLDWGIALEVEDTDEMLEYLLGTPAFMAPEMFTGKTRDIDPRTDVYLLAASLYQALSGQYPHEGSSLLELFEHAYRKDHLTLNTTNVSVELVEILQKATARGKADRYASAEEFKAALNDYLRHRNAISLTHESWVLLDGLKEQLQAIQATKNTPEDEAAELIEEARRAVFEQFTRCHTSFGLALRGWPDNPRALEGLQACLEAMIHYGLRERMAPLVRSLLPQLPEARPELEAQAKNLERMLSGAMEAMETLEAIQHERNIFVGPKTKRIIASIFFILMGIVDAWIIYTFKDGDRGGGALMSMTPTNGVVFAGLFLGLYLLVLTVSWRWVSKNQVTRRALLFIGVMGATCVFNRTLLWLDDTPVIEMVRQDMIIMAVCSLTVAVLMHWWFWVSAVLLLGGATLCFYWPPWSGEIFTIVIGLAFLVAGAPLFSDRLKAIVT